jgi:DnaK suppressor protein
MTRQNALLRLHKDLLARRDELGKKLAGELAHLRNSGSIGDSADLAFEADGDEVASRLAELDNGQLTQIELALARWQRGTLGICEGCQKQIPLARLDALPYTAFCIHCERFITQIEMTQPLSRTRRSKGNWAQVSDGLAPMQDQRVDLAELEAQISEDRRD